jgi:hypothetical protein
MQLARQGAQYRQHQAVFRQGTGAAAVTLAPGGEQGIQTAAVELAPVVGQAPALEHHQAQEGEHQWVADQGL